MTTMTRRAAPPSITSDRADMWREKAVCVDYHPDTFSPEISANAPGVVKDQHLRDVLFALRICGRCPVKRECLKDAYATGDQWTIRGGTTGEQRREFRRRELDRARGAS